MRCLGWATPNTVLTFHGIWKPLFYFSLPLRRETLNFPPTLALKGVRGLGQWLAFPHDVKSQQYRSVKEFLG